MARINLSKECGPYSVPRQREKLPRYETLIR